MLNTRDSRQVVSAGISIAVAAFALLVIYFIGSAILNNIWVVVGMAVVVLFIAIAVKITPDKAISS